MITSSRSALLSLLFLFSAAPGSALSPRAPAAKVEPYQHELHGDKRDDPYFWLRRRDAPEVLEYLKEENAYFEAAMAPTKEDRVLLYAEMRGRIKEADVSAPVKDGPYEYYRRTRDGEDYPVFCRKKAGAPVETGEETLLDVNVLAKGQPYFSVPDVVPSPDHKWIAYPVDTQGRRFYTWRFKNLETGMEIDDRIENVTPNLVWGADSRTVFYTAQHPETLRSDRIYKRELGKPGDTLLMFEEDETFSLGLYPALTRKWIFIEVESTLSTEIRYFPADPAKYELKTFLSREKEHEYSVSDGGDRFFVLTNWEAKNFRVMEVPYDRTADKTAWKEVLPHRPDTLIERVLPLKTHLAIEERGGALTRIRLLERGTPAAKAEEASELLRFQESAHVVSLGEMEEYDTPFVRYAYESMTTPPSDFDYEIPAKKHLLRKRREVPGFSGAEYESRRVFIPARDGAKVPVSLVYRKDKFKRGENPGLVYGYGSYGLSTDPDFNANVVSLLDRGFVFALAHIRGGSELGRKWYEDGRQDKKMNTFFDFIDATEALLKDGWIRQGHVYARGGSAGGLLMGAVANLRPELYRGILALVPFVDAVTTMLDASIPLTTSEYDEWGNPNDPRFYRYMKGYSPYDNVAAKAYPAIYVETGYHDSQVQYWEPAKWVAALRAKKTDLNPLLFRVEMSAGHSGRTGRFVRLEELARNYAFILMMEREADSPAR